MLEYIGMIKLRFIQFLLLLCSVSLTIQLFDMFKHQGMNLDLLIYLGLLMISLELMLHFKSNAHESLRPSNSVSATSSASPLHIQENTQNQSHHFNWSKIGLGTAAISYLIQSLWL